MADASVKIRGGAGNATQIQSRDIDAVAPTDGQALAWSNSDSEWEPTTISAGSSEWTDTGSVLHPTESTVDNVVVGGTTTGNSDIALGVDGAAVFNEQGAAVDFRVEGDTLTHLLFADGSADRIGVNTDSPDALFHIDAGGADGSEAFAISEGSYSRIAIETDFATNGNPATLKSDSQNPIMKIFTTVGRVETHKCALVKAKAQAVLTGSIDPAASTTVTGVNTRFLSEVAIGDSILVTGETRVVTAIASDTSLTVSVAFSDNANDTSPEVLPCPLTVQQSDGSLALAINSSNEVSADGAVALKSQGSAPSATADYAKLYAKDTDYSGATYKLVMHCDGADGSHNFIDSSQSQHEITVGYNAQIDTAIYKWTPGSLMLDGTSDYLEIPYSPDFDFGSGNWTVHMWYYPLSQQSDSYIMTVNAPTTNDGSYGQAVLEAIQTGSGMKVAGGSLDSGAMQWTNYGSEIALNTWHHIALVRNGTAVTCYVNGVPNSSAATVSGDLGNSSRPILIGKRSSGTHAHCHLDEIVIVKGTALWTADFSASLPSAPTPSDSAVLWAQDEQGNDTRISPHNAQNEWEYYSRNSKTGRVVRINMEKSIRVLEKLSGEKLIETE